MTDRNQALLIDDGAAKNALLWVQDRMIRNGHTLCAAQIEIVMVNFRD